MRIRLTSIWSIIWCLMNFVTTSVLSQEPSTTVTTNLIEYLPINETSIQDGQIIVKDESTYTLSTQPYQERMFGVVTLVPAKAIKLNDVPNSKPIATQGVVPVLVSTKNGAIAVGDKITSSDIPGIGMRADDAGWVIGFAQEELLQSDAPRMVNVLLHIHQAKKDKERLVLNPDKVPFVGATANDAESTETVLRFFASGIVALTTIIIGIFSFGRLAFKGIESLGRNPLAKKSIMAGIMINSSITLVIIISGVVLAYLILVT